LTGLPDLEVGCEICGLRSRRGDLSLEEFTATIPAGSSLHLPSGIAVYDRDAEPISMIHWMWLIEFHPEYKIVRHTHSGEGEPWISTVWLGLDHAFHFEGDQTPIIFETMIFGGAHDQYQERYATEEQARDGHARAELRVTT